MTSANDQGKNPMADPARDATDYPEVHPARRKPEDSAPVQTLVFLHGGNVGNWSWDPQVLAFGDFNILTLHLPAFGARFEENWEGLDSAADDVAALIADEVSAGTCRWPTGRWCPAGSVGRTAAASGGNVQGHWA